MHLPGRTLFWHTKSDEHGRSWNSSLVLCPHGSGPEKHVHGTGSMELELEAGTRWVRAATLTALTEEGEQLRLRYRPRAHLEMQGIGYRHPEWTHGLPHGEYRLAREVLDLSAPDPSLLHRWHRQLLCEVERRRCFRRDRARPRPARAPDHRPLPPPGPLTPALRRSSMSARSSLMPGRPDFGCAGRRFWSSA